MSENEQQTCGFGQVAGLKVGLVCCHKTRQSGGKDTKPRKTIRFFNYFWVRFDNKYDSPTVFMEAVSGHKSSSVWATPSDLRYRRGRP